MARNPHRGQRRHGRARPSTTTRRHRNHNRSRQLPAQQGRDRQEAGEELDRRIINFVIVALVLMAMAMFIGAIPWHMSIVIGLLEIFLAHKVIDNILKHGVIEEVLKLLNNLIRLL